MSTENTALGLAAIAKRKTEEQASQLEEITNYTTRGLNDGAGLAYTFNGSTLVTFYGDANKLCGEIVPVDNTALIASQRSLNTTGVGSVAFVDFSNNTIGFGTQIYPLVSTFPRIYSEPLSFTPTLNHPYFVEDTFIGLTQTLKITNMYTLQSHTVSYTHTSNRNRTGYGLVSKFGNATRDNSKVKYYLLQPKNPKVLFIGDSFINGWFGKRYASLIKSDLKGDAWCEGMAGANSTEILNHLTTVLINYVNPKYIFWAVGTNDTDYNTWLTNTQSFISLCTSENITPILCTTTIRTDSGSSAHNTMAALANAWIRSQSYLYADLNKITTVNYDGVTQNTSLFLSDGVHPTEACFALMADRIRVDVQEIFTK